MKLQRKLSEAVVHELADAIDAEGKKVTPDAIIDRNGEYGSYSSAYKYWRTWKAPEEAADDVGAIPPEFAPTLDQFGVRLYRAAFSQARLAADVPLQAALKEVSSLRSDTETAIAAADAAYGERDKAKREAVSLAGELHMAKTLIAALNAKVAKKSRMKKPSPVPAS